jgi:hypothetical protein
MIFKRLSRPRRPSTLTLDKVIDYLRPKLESKQIELLRTLVPTATKIAVLLNPSNPNVCRLSQRWNN